MLFVVGAHHQVIIVGLGYVDAYESDRSVLVGGGFELEAGVEVAWGVIQAVPEEVVAKAFVQS